MDYFFSFNKLGYLKGKKPQGCILCLIRDNSPNVDRLVVWENDLVMVSLNLYPYNPGHMLIFPKRHVTDIRQLTGEERGEMDKATEMALCALDSRFSPTGYNIGYNMGLSAGASIEHLHMHIIPRYRNELGIADLIGGKRVLVQDPKDTLLLLQAEFAAQRDDDQEST
ncbi:MAG TPA: HIT domain-containing protein [Spirochaetales bacterium]|nr:HIT domain-containing protein [Spirochaetales bacterium]